MSNKQSDYAKRIEINAHIPTSLTEVVRACNKYLHLKLDAVYQSKIYWMYNEKHPLSDHFVDEMATQVLLDDVLEDYATRSKITPVSLDYDAVLEVTFKPGVTDNPAKAVLDASKIVFDDVTTKNLQIFTGKLFYFKGDISKDDILKVASELLGNSLLNSFTVYTKNKFDPSRFEKNEVPLVKLTKQEVKTYNIFADIKTLEAYSKKNCWALNNKELLQIQSYYQQDSVQKQRLSFGLTSCPTDVEMEVIAQSWSEHCKHKIFSATVDYQESSNQTAKKLGSKKIPELARGLGKGMTELKKATDSIKREIDDADVVKDISKGVKEVKNNIDDMKSKL